jgi:serine/threonine protein kinase
MLEKTSLQDDDATRVKSADVDDKKSSGSPSIATQDESTLIISKLAQDKVISAELTIGSVLKDTLEIVEILGEGGMGTVFKVLNRVWEEVEARDPYVAIKVLKPELSANKQLVRSLFSDFDRTKMLANCPNIIKVYGLIVMVSMFT